MSTAPTPQPADGTTPGPDERAGVRAPPPPPANGDSALRSALSVAGTIGPPLTVITALMIYFGWARSDTQARLMGVDVSLFGFSTQDYVLQSISTLYVPLLAMAVLALGALTVHRRVRTELGRTPRRLPLRHCGQGLLTGGLAAAVLSLTLASLSSSRTSLLLPLTLALGAALAGYGAWLTEVASATTRAGQAAYSLGERALRILLVAVIITLALFWEMSSYAGVVGRGYALQLEQTVAQLPRAEAFSAAPLAIEAPGVREETVQVADQPSGQKVRYRTTGLRFLVRSGGRLFLLHDGWTIRRGVVVVLPDDDSIRWQFSR